VRPLNPTLAFAEAVGMELVYCSRGDYRQKHTPEFLAKLEQRFGRFYLIPEGGSNAAAVQGAAELGRLIPSDADACYLACGTGGTLAGVRLTAPKGCQLQGVPVLKGGDFLHQDLAHLHQVWAEKYAPDAPPPLPYTLHTDFHAGGYAKQNAELRAFLAWFAQTHPTVPLEPVYTGKLFWALYTQIKSELWPRQTHLVVIHSGGLRACLCQDAPDLRI
jgi:1-aminocyclopropane-1-carboxylate deaminase